MSYFPPRDPVRDQPNVADRLSEALQHDIGYWSAHADPNISISLDNQLENVVSRVSSINFKKLNVPPGDLPCVDLIYTFYNFISIENWEQIKFYLKVNEDAYDYEALLGTGRVLFFDALDNWAYKDFNHLINRGFEAKTFALDDFYYQYDPEVQKVFAKNYVKKWVIRLHLKEVPVHYPSYHPNFEFWVDAGPFIYRNPLYHTTRFEAYENGTPVNKPVTVTSTVTGEVWTPNTPFQLNLLQENDSVYIIDVNPQRFDRWEDGSVLSTREYIPRADKTLIAYYAPIIRHQLTIESEPSGKGIYVGGVHIQTPRTLMLSPETYKLEAVDKTNFVRWENGDTNPIRNINVQSDMTVKAFFTEDGDGAPPDGEGSPLLSYLLLGGLAAGTGYIFYKSLKK